MIQEMKNNALTKAKSRKGFTLAELLIVVAIIAILIAIAIPLFTKQLDSAKKATDDANFRTAKAIAISYEIDLLDGVKEADLKNGAGAAVSNASKFDAKLGDFAGSDEYKGQSKNLVGQTINLKIDSNKKVTAEWSGATATP